MVKPVCLAELRSEHGWLHNPRLTQEEISRHLYSAWLESGRYDSPLDLLEKWSIKAGYFDHIQQTNDILTFPCDELGVKLRLQINYTRLRYKAPPGSSTAAGNCPLCYHNIASKAKPQLRVFELTLQSAAPSPTHFMHLTPFPLYPGHFVLNRRHHEPMRIDADAISDAFNFLSGSPGWLAASNSDVEWAGASILMHHHAQVFRDVRLPLEDAVETTYRMLHGGVRESHLKWLGPVMRLSGPPDSVMENAVRLISSWKNTDPGKATCNFLARMPAPNIAVVHLIWRHPAYRTSGTTTDIKTEGVGIVEMAGEVIVPPLPNHSRSENRAYFLEHGLNFAKGLIQMNSPAAGPA